MHAGSLVVNSVFENSQEPMLVDSVGFLVLSLTPLAPKVLFPFSGGFPEISLMFDWESLHLFPPVVSRSLSDSLWARYQLMSIAEYH